MEKYFEYRDSLPKSEREEYSKNLKVASDAYKRCLQECDFGQSLGDIRMVCVKEKEQLEICKKALYGSNMNPFN